MLNEPLSLANYGGRAPRSPTCWQRAIGEWPRLRFIGGAIRTLVDLEGLCELPGNEKRDCNLLELQEGPMLKGRTVKLCSSP